MNTLSNLSQPLQEETSNKRASYVLLICGILFISFNLRPSITSVGPLVPIIRDSTGMSNGVAGLLTAIPLLSFALFSLIAPKLGIRFGSHVSIFAALIILTGGIFIRSIGITFLIFAGTALVGIGIAICNVLLPGVIKLNFPQKVGVMTSIYTASMGLFASIGSGVSIPLSESLGLGWQWALAIWSVLTIIALFVWFPQIKRDKHIEKPSKMEWNTNLSESIWASPLAWCVTLFMGFQSFLFYSVITWIPDVLQELGMNLSLAGGMLFLLQLVGIPFSFAAPILADKMTTQKPIVLGICTLYVLGFLGLIFYPTIPIIITAVIFIGIAQGAAISLALTLISLRAKTAKHASLLSGMAQSFGYFLAAIGPILLGILYDIYHTWSPFLYILLCVSFIILFFGMKGSVNRYIELKS
ncbi:CynX/NimT family MFS transporter [Aliibacillus thermotolerans]|uniref:CynX/NimT family MFS transporter n=1 Tax=Aliibacillus thermotolerans TaxID=1834418 RepID=A0ABW0U5D6_9BACI